MIVFCPVFSEFYTFFGKEHRNYIRTEFILNKNQSIRKKINLYAWNISSKKKSKRINEFKDMLFYII